MNQSKKTPALENSLETTIKNLCQSLVGDKLRRSNGYRRPYPERVDFIINFCEVLANARLSEEDQQDIIESIKKMIDNPHFMSADLETSAQIVFEQLLHSADFNILLILRQKSGTTFSKLIPNHIECTGKVIPPKQIFNLSLCDEDSLVNFTKRYGLEPVWYLAHLYDKIIFHWKMPEKDIIQIKSYVILPSKLGRLPRTLLFLENDIYLSKVSVYVNWHNRIMWCCQEISTSIISKHE